MIASLCLCCCVLAAAQPVERADWVLVPRLSRAQELVYRGTFTEEASGDGVQFNRTYRIESRVFVLETPPPGASVALLTVLRLRNPPGSGVVRAAAPAEDFSLYSVRLALARIDLQGRVTAEAGGPLTVPLDGPPTLECGAFVEMPRSRVGPDRTWEVAEDGRPPRSWTAGSSETVNGTGCVKLVGVQQSDDWDRPRTDRVAWRRTDTVWVAPRTGVAHRVERTIERREPARKEPTQRTTLRYELESNLQYPGPLFADRRKEIQQARGFAESAAPLLPTPTKNVPQLEALLTKINYHLDNQPPTPYREAILEVKRRVEAARRGEAPPAPPPETPAARPPTAALGQVAPDFVATDFTSQETARLRRWQGRPVVLFFYNPTSATAEELLRFAQSLQELHRERVAVVGLAMSNDADKVRKQHAELRLGFPILNGQGLRVSYNVEATPQLVVLDAEGLVRSIHVGWGGETADEVTAALKKCLGGRR